MSPETQACPAGRAPCAGSGHFVTRDRSRWSPAVSLVKQLKLHAKRYTRHEVAAPRAVGPSGRTALRQIFKNGSDEFLSAIHFLTRVPVSAPPYQPDSLARAVKFFPLVGLLIGASAGLLHLLLAPHLSRLAAALFVVAFLVAITGCLHEDGLADAADGFGGGWTREQVLLILRDSRIGSYGATVLILSLLARVLLLSATPLPKMMPYLIAAHVLCRWTTLPLSFYLAPARTPSSDGAAADGMILDGLIVDGQGARVASLTTSTTLWVGTCISFAIVAFTLRLHALLPIVLACGITLLTGLYYKRRIGGVTGDCFGATNQLTELAVYTCAAWIL